MPLQPGTTLGSYAVTAKIGEGGMGEVYRATDTKLGQRVALKLSCSLQSDRCPPIAAVVGSFGLKRQCDPPHFRPTAERRRASAQNS